MWKYHNHGTQPSQRHQIWLYFLGDFSYSFDLNYTTQHHNTTFLQNKKHTNERKTKNATEILP